MNKSIIIKTLKTIISAQTKLPILESVYLSGDHLSVSDLRTTVSIPYKSGVNICVPANQFTSVLDIMNNPSFKVTEIAGLRGDTISSVEISDGKRKIKVMGENPCNLPRTPFESSNAPDFFHVGEISDQELKYIEEAMEFTSNDKLRPALTGVYIGEDVVGTDAHRLYWKKLQNMNENFIMSKKTIKAMLVFGGAWQVYCGITYCADEREKQQEPEIENKCIALLNEEGVLITFIPINGKFLDYKVVIPNTEHAAFLEINPAILRKELSNALKFSNPRTNMGVLTLNGNVKLYSSDVDMGHEYEVPFDKEQVNYKGELDIAFDMKLLDSIASLLPKKEVMRFQFWSSTKCTIINNRYLLMPVMLHN